MRQRLTSTELVVALESYSSHLEPSFVSIKLPPTQHGNVSPSFDLSPSYVISLDREFTRVYEEYTRRIESVMAIAEEIVNLWAELGTPQAQTDGSIVKHYKTSPEQLGLHESDIARLSGRRDKLSEEKKSRERKLKELKTSVESLWDRLGIEDMERKRFLAGVRGCGLRAINELEAELYRLNELKRQNLHLFVEDARFKLQELWDSLYFSEEEMLAFTPAFSDVYSDALLSAHESEIVRLEALKEQRMPTLQMIEKHRSLIKDREDLAASSQDASRLLMAKGQKGEKRDPGKLLREEKMRKRIAKELPRVETEVRKMLERWEEEYGRPFLVHGEPYLDEVAAEAAKAVPPPRSKTPNGLSVSTNAPKTAVKSTTTLARSNTLTKVAPRSTVKTPISTIRRNPLAASTASGTGTGTIKMTSPSKIPARVPLGSMKNGNNSPERRIPAPQPHLHHANTIRGKIDPPHRAPPPKMRDLYNAPEPTTSISEGENWRSNSALSSSSGGLVRQVTPEDVYDDRERMSYAHPSYLTQSHRPTITQAHFQPPTTNTYDSHYKPHQYITHDSRVASIESGMSQAQSGSENWETYDDGSEAEVEASNAYYAKLKAACGKRVTPEGGHPSPRQAQSKKLRNIYDQGPVQTYVEHNGRMIPSGSEAGWTDEDAF